MHSRGELARGEQARGEQARGELARGELARGELARGELERGELARGELARGELARAIYIIRKVQNKLLGLSAIKALNLVTQVNSVKENLPEKYPLILTGLGTFKSEYEIQLRLDAQLFALFTPRNVTLPLLEKVRQVFD